MLYCVVCLGRGEGCISDYQGCYAVLCCMFGGCISDYQGCYDVLCCMFFLGGGCISEYQGCYAVLYCMFGDGGGGGVHKRLSRIKDNLGTFIIGDHDIVPEEYVKLLGLHVDRKLNFNTHISNISQKQGDK